MSVWQLLRDALVTLGILGPRSPTLHATPSRLNPAAGLKSFFEWFSESGIDRERPWLILGKGPSFSRHPEFDLRAFHRLSLNDAARELPVDVAHAVDLHAIERSGEAIAANARVLVMPWHPHIDFKPASETLEELARRVPVLGRLAREDRLLWYNHSKTRDHRPGSPVISVRYFSAEGALNLLAAAGVHCVRSLGVDGGAQYGASFQDLSYRLLANGQPDFERQFSEFAKTILRSGIDFAPLDTDSPMRIFVGAEERGLLAARVLEYSIKKRTSMTTSVVVIGTHPLELQRLLVPELMNWSGRALYLDGNMQALRDLRGLWNTPMRGAAVNAGASGSPMLLDCGSLDWRIKDTTRDLGAGGLSPMELVRQAMMGGRVANDIDARWNSPDRLEKGVTGLLRYADPQRQPWISAENELSALWVADLIEAVGMDFIPLGFVEEQVALGHARPSLLWQIEQRAADGRILPDAVRMRDAAFASAARQTGCRPSS